MRTTKELLVVMLKNQDLFSEGLCTWVDTLHSHKKITDIEHDELRHYIYRHRPHFLSSINTFTCRNSGFFWPYGRIKPRLKWIRKHIEKLE